jgi:hypothetical protein
MARQPDQHAAPFARYEDSASDEYEIDALAERFFSQDALYPPALDLEDERTRSARSSKRAMHVTFVMLAVSALTLVAFLLYMRLIMPVPEELGQAGPLPAPIAPNLYQPPPSAAGPALDSLVTTATNGARRDVDLDGVTIPR